MAYLPIEPVRRGHGLGDVASIIGAILGPVVEGGASIFAVREQSKQHKRELQQRQAEAQKQAELARQTLEAQERQALVAQQAALQQSQITSHWTTQVAPYVIGGVGIGVAGLVLLTLVKRSRRAK